MRVFTLSLFFSLSLLTCIPSQRATATAEEGGRQNDKAAAGMCVQKKKTAASNIRAYI